MPKEAREMAGFLAMVVYFATITRPSTLTPTGIRCFSKGCHGIIRSALKPDKLEEHWYCPECERKVVV
jgi:hypothetical protein